MTELILIRHGETDWNLQHRFQGQADTPLNQRGFAQAQRLVARLADEGIEVFACSDLLRTRQTAAPAATALGFEPQTLRGLREQSFGILEGMVHTEIEVQYPEVWARWRQYTADYAPPQGESLKQFYERVTGTVLELARRNEGRLVAAVTHGGALDMIWRAANGLPAHGPRTCEIPNVGLNRVRVTNGKFEILQWADDSHVADLGGVRPLGQRLWPVADEPTQR